jgi:hypothetical protein
MPHWSATNTATSKEIWVEPVNRFLGALSVYTSDFLLLNGTGQQKKKVSINTETKQSDNGEISVSITVKGSGKHNLEIKAYNAVASVNKKEINLGGNKSEEIELDLKVSDKTRPYVAVISTDSDPDLQKEIVGSFIKPSFWQDLKE